MNSIEKREEEAYQKMLRYCSYQERYEAQVREKLYALELPQSSIDKVIDVLIDFGILNETKFAESYVRGKIRIKKWGRIKIRQKLKQLKVNSTSLSNALDAFDDEEYKEIIITLIHKKDALTEADNIYTRRDKISKYIIGKGFEPSIVWDLLAKEI